MHDIHAFDTYLEDRERGSRRSYFNTPLLETLRGLEEPGELHEAENSHDPKDGENVGAAAGVFIAGKENRHNIKHKSSGNVASGLLVVSAFGAIVM